MTIDAVDRGEADEAGVPASRAAVRSRLVEVAAHLMHEQGPAAVTTRAVAAAAGVQAPTIYRLFGDKDGLLDAVAEHAATAFVAAKARAAQAEAEVGADPLADLRAAFFAQVEFGVADPAVFRLLSDPARVLRSGAARAGREVLQARVHRLALAGLLRVDEARCVNLVQSAGTGVIQTLLATAPQDRDEGLAAAIWDALVAAMLVTPPAAAASGAAGDRSAALVVAFRAMAPELPQLSSAERALLVDWLDRATSPSDAR